MRRIIVHLQSTLDNRCTNDQGTFWQPFPFGDPEMAYINQFFGAADTFALSRIMYDAIIPWWDGVATGQLPADAPEISPTFAGFPSSAAVGAAGGSKPSAGPERATLAEQAAPLLG
jgi:hypothetical protein